MSFGKFKRAVDRKRVLILIPLFSGPNGADVLRHRWIE
jgi:hypothetical protein